MGLRVAVETALSRLGDPALRLLPSRSTQPAVVCLIFHSVTDRPRFKIDVDPPQLRRVLETITREGAPILPLETAVRRLRSGSLEGGAVVLSFDDGYKDFLGEAAPILRELEAPATVSVVPRFVESQEPFDFQTGQGRYSLSWEELRRLQGDFGDLVTIANHSFAHRNFAALEEDEIRRDLERSQAAIQDALGFVPRVFTFPFGASSPLADSIAGATFDVLLGGSWGRNYAGSAAAPLRRIAVFGYDGAATRTLKARGARTTYQTVRDLWGPLRRVDRRA